MKSSKIILIALCAIVFLACNQVVPTASPTEVFKAQNEARKKKDGATMKKNLSKASLELIEKAAQTQNKSIEELLVMEVPGVQQPDDFEYRNEKIDSDTASVEIKAKGFDEWTKVYFVKEDGRWKIALDKLIDDVKKAQETQPTIENTNSVNANSTNTTKRD